MLGNSLSGVFLAVSQRRHCFGLPRVILALLIALASGIPDFSGLQSGPYTDVAQVGAADQQSHGDRHGFGSLLAFAEELDSELGDDDPPLLLASLDEPRGEAVGQALAATERLSGSHRFRAHRATGPPSR